MIFLVKGVINSVIFNTNMLYLTLNVDERIKLVKKAFTLAEVLITLGIIGVVAAITLPALIQKQQEKILVNQLKKSYSAFSQAFLMVVAENGPAESWDIGNDDTPEGANKLYNLFKPHLSVIEDCGANSGCFYQGTYKALNAPALQTQPSTYTRYARGRLSDGTAFLFATRGSGCNADYSSDGSGRYSRICGQVYVDINGDKNPNQAGVDYFLFMITKDGIYPAGLKGYRNPYGLICQYNNTNNTNGPTCSGWVIMHENMDYLRRDISNEL